MSALRTLVHALIVHNRRVSVKDSIGALWAFQYSPQRGVQSAASPVLEREMPSLNTHLVGKGLCGRGVRVLLLATCLSAKALDAFASLARRIGASAVLDYHGFVSIQDPYVGEPTIRFIWTSRYHFCYHEQRENSSILTGTICT